LGAHAGNPLAGKLECGEEVLSMPLTKKGEEIKKSLTEEYGERKGTSILYAGKNKGTFSGIDADEYMDSVRKGTYNKLPGHFKR
jgi:hypothetical protein